MEIIRYIDCVYFGGRFSQGDRISNANRARGLFFMIIDNEVFGSYSLCKYKGFLKYTGKKGIISDYEEFQKQREDEYKMTAVRQLLKKYGETNVLKERSVNNDDLKTGHRILLGITIEHKDLHVHVDLLEKIRRKSALGSFSYIPYMFVPNKKVGKHDKCLLAFIGYIQPFPPQIPYGHVTHCYY